MGKTTFLVHPEDVAIYSPPAHTGTRNRRLVGSRTVRAKKMEVVLGELESGGQAELHYHQATEQAFYLLEGKCLVEVEGESDEMRPGDVAFFAPGKRHRLVALGGPIKGLVIYAPPLENQNSAFRT